MGLIVGASHWSKGTPSRDHTRSVPSRLQESSRVLALDVIATMRKEVAAMVTVAPRISAALERERARCRQKIEDECARWPDHAAAVTTAHEHLRAFSISLAALRAARRPSLTISAFAAIAPARFRADLSASVLSANAVTVRKVLDPQGRRAAVGKGRTPQYRLDRPDAIEYLVENTGMCGRQLIVAGARLLGPWMATAPLIKLLLGHEIEEVRRGALGALLLLAECRAVERECRRRRRVLEADGRARSLVSNEDERAALWWVEKLSNS